MEQRKKIKSNQIKSRSLARSTWGVGGCVGALGWD